VADSGTKDRALIAPDMSTLETNKEAVPCKNWRQTVSEMSKLEKNTEIGFRH
jgi:hypothetical protein